MTVDDAKDEVACASRILAGEGILDAFGHVSCRHPVRENSFLVSRSLAPALVTRQDIVELDLDGRPVDGSCARLFLERFIHSEIYRSRPDVSAVVHSHALAVLPFSVVPSVRVRPVYHLCGYLEGTPVPFDTADHAGPGSDLLVRDGKLGAALAHHLGDAVVVLMRGHGFTAVGTGIPEATYRAIYTARNCEVQLAALRLGEPQYLTATEALACDATNSGQINRAWNLWRRTHSGFVATKHESERL